MEYQKFIQQQRLNWITKQDINKVKPQEKVNHWQYTPRLGICKNKQTKYTKYTKKEPNQVNETMHQRHPLPSNANTSNQPLVQAVGNNERRETETREPVSGNQVSESGKTGPLTTQ
ncbi:Hypothetical_protein [Hexamita inflata]|nr:Hypothetical protein HINF_LOCUS6727 [Hexamita inflata]